LYGHVSHLYGPVTHLYGHVTHLYGHVSHFKVTLQKCMVTLHICDLDCEASMRYGEIGREEQSEGLTGAGDFRRHHFSAMISRGR